LNIDFEVHFAAFGCPYFLNLRTILRLLTRIKLRLWNFDTKSQRQNCVGGFGEGDIRSSSDFCSKCKKKKKKQINPPYYFVLSLKKQPAVQANHRQLLIYKKTDQNYIDMPKIIIFQKLTCAQKMRLRALNCIWSFPISWSRP
jgi:hypothetical protein